MIKLLILTILLFVSVQARENPFFPSAGEKDLLNTTNKDLSVSPLKRAAISLPSSARTIQKVTIEYKNLDGSLQSRTIKLNNAVDWHIPIFISQSMNNIKEVKEKDKEVKNIQTKKAAVYKQLLSSKHIKFYKNLKDLKIETDDKMVRSFLLAKPYRLVFDFKKDVNLKSEEKVFSSKIFKKINIGTHDGFYRAVILLDGQYRFKKYKQKYGYKIRLY